MSHFRKGQLVATQRIERVIEAPGCETRYWCRCEKCGHETGKSGARLRTIKSNNPQVCGYCYSHGVVPVTRRATEPKRRSCRRCEGMPHRRPESGACDCGELYEADFIMVEPRGFSPIALLGEA